MDDDIRNLLEARRSEIEASLSELVKTRNELWDEFLKLDGKIDQVRSQLEKIDVALSAIDDRASKKTPTIMQAVIEVLKSKPDGMTAQEILAEINKNYFDGTIVRTSLSPQLSRLKDRDKKIDLRGTRWFLLPEQPSLFPPVKRRF
ncbi:hypothetical protein P0R31_30500 [Bradyrhizobium yuanmingense]|uniref:hypothetical protein n=1 Tax=Bradyrhizobium yuanmingense TaxID=108015 RepID=UPI0023B8968F|nr:hypothetical protein [Bradyrhizobium yuanmingense]MDF0521580.1 hypothetical protein [Bradyrhizobium yuanmingense]